MHHQHYIVNLRFLWLPMVDGFPRDNSVIKDMSLIVSYNYCTRKSEVGVGMLAMG